MTDFTLRSNKGTALTFNELDGNFNEIQRRTGSGWNDLVQEVIVKSGTNAPTIDVLRNGIQAYSFPPDSMAECYANFHIRHDYIAGTMVYPHVHWSMNTVNTGTVRWGVEYTLARRHDSTGTTHFGPTSTLYISVAVDADHKWGHMVSESLEGDGIPGTDLQEDAMILCRFFRDAEHPSDTFPDPVFLLSVDIHYECDTLCTPLRFPPFV